jgi:proteasome accessory factor B
VVDKSLAEPEERQLALLVALLRTRRPLMRSELWRTLPGAWPDTAAGRRKFERDKRALRSLGIEFLYDPRRHSYSLDRRALRLGRLDLPEAEAVLLRQAAALAVEADGFPYGPEALGALVRLSAAGRRTSPLAEPPDDLLVHHPSLEVGRHPDLPNALARLLAAVRRRLVVTFRYRPEGGGAERARRVEPWGLFCKRGRWYLSGRCLDAGAERTFRVTRATSLRVRGLPDAGPAFERPADFDPGVRADRPPWRFAVHAARAVTIQVDRALADALARQLGGEVVQPGRVSVSTTNEPALLEELRRHLPRVAVVAPSDAAERWRRPLRALAGRHGSAP